MTKITPIGDRIVVKPFTPDMKTAGGIILLTPQEDADAPKKGIVVSVGAGKAPDPMFVSPGDQVLFNPYAGLTIHVDGIELILMSQTAVMVKFEEA